LRNLSKSGKLQELSWKIPSFPHHGADRARGMMWNIDVYGEQIRQSEKDSSGLKVKKINVTVFALDSNGAVEWKTL